jgi:DNA-binding CsgD family transcriptional regulator
VDVYLLGKEVMSLDLSSELNSCLSGNDALRLLEIIQRSLASDSEEDFKGLFPLIQELLSSDYAIAALGRLDGSKSVVIADGVNISFPEGWCDEYISKNYVRSDPVVKENFMNYRLQWWSDTKKRIPCKGEQKKIAELCMDFNMHEGYTVGSNPLSPGKNGSMFCYSGRSMKNDNRTETIIECITPHLHLALSNVYGKKRSNTKKVVLSLREKEVLNWLKQGKSSWDMSVILGISERTINYHVYNIMQKLDVVNRPQALAAAARLGLIDFA